MTKSELSAAIAVKTGQTVETAQQCVDALMDVIKETMAKGENIYLRIVVLCITHKMRKS